VDSFDFYRKRRQGYVPRTPATALRAIGAGMLPAEYFIHASGSAKPLDEEPYDLEAIERALSRPDMNVGTARLLKGILERLIMGREPETALFGAEGINSLEARYLHRIEAVRARLGKGVQAGGKPADQTGTGVDPLDPWRVRLARLYHELSELQGRARNIRTFYLREAHELLRAVIRHDRRVSPEVLDLLVNVLVDLGLHDQAAHVLDKARPAEDPFILLRVARVAFHRRSFRRVAECCRALERSGAALTEAERRAVAFWAGGDGGAEG
jgi:hypothetical protein